MPGCARGCGTGQGTIRAAGSVLPTTMPALRAGRSTTRKSSGSGATRACGYRNDVGASVSARPRHRTPRPRMRRMWCGRWISSSTPPPTAARSRSCPLWTNTPVNASAAWSTATSPVTTSSPSSTASPSTAVIRPCCAATTAPNSPAPQWPTGPANAPACTSSHLGSPGATDTSSRSTAGCGTSA
jgi:hypothetical protein